MKVLENSKECLNLDFSIDFDFAAKCYFVLITRFIMKIWVSRNYLLTCHLSAASAMIADFES